jgi:hypothetical protein
MMGCLLGVAPQVFGLGSNYAEVLVENLQIGMVYNLTQITQMPLETNNASEETINVQVEPIKPDTPIAGYEAIPSADWVKINSSEFALGPNGKHTSDIQISIPKDKKYLGKRFQVDIFSHMASKTIDRNFMKVKLGVRGRLLFSIAPVVKERSALPASMNLNFRPMPERLEVKNVVLGQKREVLTWDNKNIEIENLGKDQLELIVESVDPKAMEVKDDSYSPCPNPAFLKMEKEKITLAGDSKVPLKLWLEFPENTEYANQKYLFVISLKNTGSIAGRRLLRIFATIGSTPVVGKKQQ